MEHPQAMKLNIEGTETAVAERGEEKTVRPN